MGNGDIVVGSRPSTRKSKTVISENPKRAAIPPGDQPPAQAAHHCGAMSQQRADGGAMSTPQKFVHLVGCRDSKAKPPTGR